MARFPNRAFAVRAFVLSVGFALFQCAKSGELADASEHAMGLILTSRFVGIATFIVVAILFFWRAPSPSQALAVAVPFMAVYCLTALVVPMLDDSSLGMTVLYAAGMLHGIASALYRLTYLSLFASYEPKQCAVLLGASHLASNLLLPVFSVLDVGLLSIVRIVLVLASTVAVLYLTKDPAEGGSAVVSENGEPPAESARRRAESRTFPANRVEWFLLLAASFLFSALFGVIAQVSSAGNPDSFALYDVSTSAALVMLNVLLLAFLCLAGDQFTFGEAVLFVGALYASGCALYPALFQTDNPLAGVLVRGGFDCGSILLWILMARKVHEQPERAYGYFGILFGLGTVYPGRAIGYFALSGSAGLSFEAASGLSIAALWCVCMFGIVAFFLSSKKGQILSRLDFSLQKAKDEESLLAVGVCEGPDSFADGLDPSVRDEACAKAVDFGLQVEEFAQRHKLSKREKEVLVETLHGRSRVAIAEKLYLSPGTVKTYLSRIYDKAGVSSKQELIDQLENGPSS